MPCRVTKLIEIAPLPPTSAPAAADVTVTASIASWRGRTGEKNPSVDLLKVSWLLTPSSLMSRNDSGRPLTVASPRATPVWFTPTRNVTAFSTSRVGIGICAICSMFIVADTVAVCVLTSSAAVLLTVTVSAIPPTSSVALTLVGIPSCTRTSVTTAVLKPARETVTLVGPDRQRGHAEGADPVRQRFEFRPRGVARDDHGRAGNRAPGGVEDDS